MRGLRRYREGGLAGLADQSWCLHGCSGQTSAEVEAVICELRREHPRWGARRIAHELARTADRRRSRGSRCTGWWPATAW